MFGFAAYEAAVDPLVVVVEALAVVVAALVVVVTALVVNTGLWVVVEVLKLVGAGPAPPGWH